MPSVHPVEAGRAPHNPRSKPAARAFFAVDDRPRRRREDRLRPFICWLALAAGAVSSFASANTPGTLDTNFNAVGIALTQIGSSSEAHDVVIQPDGKVVVAGSAVVAGNRDFALARYNANGSLDLGFGMDGVVAAGIGAGADRCYAVALQQDGKIICAGLRGDESSIGLIRFNANGSIDSSFGSSGRFSIAIGASWNWATDVAIQPDGKILVSAYVDNFNGQYRVGVVRILPSGSLDPSFANGGILTPSIGIGAAISNAIALQSDGKIVVGGFYISPGGNEDFLVLRYLGDGTPDTSFDGDGIVISQFTGTSDRITGIHLQADGRIVAAGMPSSACCVMIARYLADGSPDTTFDVDGLATVNMSGSTIVSAVATQANGKVVTAGTTINGQSRLAFLLLRHNVDGSLDTGFGSGGISTQSVAGNDEVLGLAIQPDGKLVAAGRGGDRIAVARFHGDPPTNEVFANGFEQP
jgi:uncharacterized delta-60 repeat protein